MHKLVDYSHLEQKLNNKNMDCLGVFPNFLILNTTFDLQHFHSLQWTDIDISNKLLQENYLVISLFYSFSHQFYA